MIGSAEWIRHPFNRERRNSIKDTEDAGVFLRRHPIGPLSWRFHLRNHRDALTLRESLAFIEHNHTAMNLAMQNHDCVVS